MAELIATFADGGTLEFDWGQFDGWCVFLTRPGVGRYAPKDTEYFAAMRRLASRHGAERMYGDFIAVYDRTGRALDSGVIALIKGSAEAYGPDALLAEIVLATLYAGMVAEENKDRARLGKRVKRLGVHQILLLGMPVQVAAEYSKGKPCRVIAAECERLGF